MGASLGPSYHSLSGHGPQSAAASSVDGSWISAPFVDVTSVSGATSSSAAGPAGRPPPHLPCKRIIVPDTSQMPYAVDRRFRRNERVPNQIRDALIWMGVLADDPDDSDSDRVCDDANDEDSWSGN